MKRKIFIILLLQTFLYFETIVAQITFQKAIGGIGNEAGMSVQQTTDGGYIIVGTTFSFGAGGSNVYLIKTDANGNSIWTKTYGGNGDDFGNFVQQTTDGGYIIIGSTGSYGAVSHNIYLIKTDDNGNFSWSKTYGGSFDYGSCVRQTNDGGYILSGTAYFYNPQRSSLYLIKTNANGDSLWTKSFGGTNHEYGYNVEQTFDGGYIIAGTTTSFSPNGGAFLVRTDSLGDMIWSKTYGGTIEDGGEDVQQTSDGNFILVGWTASFGVSNTDVYLIKINSSGHKIWSKTYGGTGFEYGHSVKQTSDGGFIIVGESGVGDDIYFIKTDSIGDPMWFKTIGGSNDDIGYAVQQTSDGGYIITGSTKSFGSGNIDVYLIKTDTNGNSGCNVLNTTTIVNSPLTMLTNPPTSIGAVNSPVISHTSAVDSGGTVTTLCTTVGVPSIFNFQSSIFNISPNPFTDVINITAPVNDLSEIILYDITSRKILQQSFTKNVSINTSQFSKGIYFYEVKNKNVVISKGKVIKD